MVHPFIFVISYAVLEGLCAALYPFRPLAKVVRWILLSNVLKDQSGLTIQPPPQISILRIADLWLLFRTKSWDLHRQASHKIAAVFLTFIKKNYFGFVRKQQPTIGGQNRSWKPVLLSDDAPCVQACRA